MTRRKILLATVALGALALPGLADAADKVMKYAHISRQRT